MVVSPNEMLWCCISCTVVKPTFYYLVSDQNLNPNSCMTCFPWGLRLLHGIFIDLAGMAGWQSQPAGRYSVVVDRSKPKTLDELEQQIRDMLATVPLGVFLSKSVESPSLRLQRRVKNVGPTLKSWSVWVLHRWKNCSSITFLWGDATD
jgi:hypothetical protein